MAVTLLERPPVRDPIADVEGQIDTWDGRVLERPTGKLLPIWQQWFQQFTRLVIFGGYVIQTTRADAPTTLTVADAGLVFYITDFGHFVRWNGSAYEFMGDPSGRFEDFAVAPGLGWALADGSATTYLTVGATLGVTNITLPNLSGSPAYKKSGAAYTGTILAASGASGAASPGTDSQGAHMHTVSGSTASEAAHTHSISSDLSTHDHSFSATTSSDGAHSHNATNEDGTANGDSNAFWAGGNSTTSDGAHTHSASGTTGTANLAHSHGGGTGAGSAHSHGAGTLAADSAGAHTHTVNSHTHGPGDLDVPRLVVLPYFRR